MKTSKQWWDSIKSNPELMNDWLIKQYRGEVTAARRIREFADKFVTDAYNRTMLDLIAVQEETRAGWVGQLLEEHGIIGHIDNAEDRYWKQTLPEIKSEKLGAAVGAHAEAMRLERIKAIVMDETSPSDIRDVFERILIDENFHEAFFRNMAGAEAMAETLNAHVDGLNALGLEP